MTWGQAQAVKARRLIQNPELSEAKRNALLSRLSEYEANPQAQLPAEGIDAIDDSRRELGAPIAQLTLSPAPGKKKAPAPWKPPESSDDLERMAAEGIQRTDEEELQLAKDLRAQHDQNYNDAAHTASKLRELEAPPEWSPPDAGAMARLSPIAWKEPSPEQFLADVGSSLNKQDTEAAKTDPTSLHAYKVYSDEKWKAALEQAQAANAPIVRTAFIPGVWESIKQKDPLRIGGHLGATGKSIEAGVEGAGNMLSLGGADWATRKLEEAGAFPEGFTAGLEENRRQAPIATGIGSGLGMLSPVGLGPTIFKGVARGVGAIPMKGLAAEGLTGALARGEQAALTGAATGVGIGATERAFSEDGKVLDPDRAAIDALLGGGFGLGGHMLGFLPALGAKKIEQGPRGPAIANAERTGVRLGPLGGANLPPNAKRAVQQWADMPLDVRPDTPQEMLALKIRDRMAGSAVDARDARIAGQELHNEAYFSSPEGQAQVPIPRTVEAARGIIRSNKDSAGRPLPFNELDVPEGRLPSLLTKPRLEPEDAQWPIQEVDPGDIRMPRPTPEEADRYFRAPPVGAAPPEAAEAVGNFTFGHDWIIRNLERGKHPDDLFQEMVAHELRKTRVAGPDGTFSQPQGLNRRIEEQLRARLATAEKSVPELKRFFDVVPPTKEIPVVYRGIAVDDDLARKFLRDPEITMDATTSSSWDPVIAEDFARTMDSKMRMETPGSNPMTVMLKLRHKSGRAITDYSFYGSPEDAAALRSAAPDEMRTARAGSEKEVLLPPGSRYRVVRRYKAPTEDPSETRVVIEAEEIGDPVMQYIPGGPRTMNARELSGEIERIDRLANAGKRAESPDPAYEAFQRAAREDLRQFGENDVSRSILGDGPRPKLEGEELQGLSAIRAQHAEQTAAEEQRLRALSLPAKLPNRAPSVIEGEGRPQLRPEDWTAFTNALKDSYKSGFERRQAAEYYAKREPGLLEDLRAIGATTWGEELANMGRLFGNTTQSGARYGRIVHASLPWLRSLASDGRLPYSALRAVRNMRQAPASLPPFDPSIAMPFGSRGMDALNLRGGYAARGVAGFGQEDPEAAATLTEEDALNLARLIYSTKGPEK